MYRYGEESDSSTTSISFLNIPLQLLYTKDFIYRIWTYMFHNLYFSSNITVFPDLQIFTSKIILITFYRLP